MFLYRMLFKTTRLYYFVAKRTCSWLRTLQCQALRSKGSHRPATQKTSCAHLGLELFVLHHLLKIFRTAQTDNRSHRWSEKKQGRRPRHRRRLCSENMKGRYMTGLGQITVLKGTQLPTSPRNLEQFSLINRLGMPCPFSSFSTEKNSKDLKLILS